MPTNNINTLIYILDAAGGPVPRTQLNRQLYKHGIKGATDISFVMTQAKRSRLIRITSDGIELTPKGQRLNGSKQDG